MSIVHLQNVEMTNATANFADPYIFRVTFECISPLSEDIEWKLIYVGSAASSKYDQELDSCMVGPVPVGVNSFEFEAEAPSPSKIPETDLLGVTVILLTASYKDAEFIRVGYYVNNFLEKDYLESRPDLQQYVDDPNKVLDLTKVDLDVTKLRREVLVSKPRVTRFNIKWDFEDAPAQQSDSLQTSQHTSNMTAVA
ncbi:hypothetical protein CF327_g2696 [Tilletia walkeri]|uniref:Anti-silencing function protein 1 n=1 Tax=Tilletia walkeri TaxID=117179 RepID=A0A8X7N814_9BASI|nr:hypothetical protein CF327_g2696 [Tilletia walkeri]KAE8268217.1 hypothetical protein A4X09_0g4122 [Tilletia walkeri]